MSSPTRARPRTVKTSRFAPPPQLGFADDGYDYLQHLRELGRGGGGATLVEAMVKPVRASPAPLCTLPPAASAAATPGRTLTRPQVLPEDARVYDARDGVAPKRAPQARKASPLVKA